MSQPGTLSKQVDMQLEVDVVPVSDVERSKQFYARLGWRLDADDAPAKDIRIVQFTPPGSACSVTFGMGSCDVGDDQCTDRRARRGSSYSLAERDRAR